MVRLATEAERFDPESEYDASWESNSTVDYSLADEYEERARIRTTKKKQDSTSKNRTRASSRDLARTHRAWALSQKLNRQCADCHARCDESNYPAFHWDHLPGSVKLFEISESARRSRADVLMEMAKCEIRCANCHAIVTYVRKYGSLTGKESNGE
jgi:hypothetical protein